MINTYNIATEIVAFLKSSFKSNLYNIPSIKNVYITGSYVRNDWLNMSSDLDIQILFYKDSKKDIRKHDITILQNSVCDTFGDIPFPSQAMDAPFGLDWSINDCLPNENDIITISPFTAYNIFYFDFYKNRKLLYGNDFTNELPKPVPIMPLIKPTIEFLTQRIFSNLYDIKKCAYVAYKIAVILQLNFGELTIDKRKILELYLLNVPEFSHKIVGELIIRNYIESFYPDRKPIYFERKVYEEFAKVVVNLI